MVRFDPIDLARERLARNQNALIAMTGQTGTGKSLSALEYARLLDPDFNVEKVVFTVKDFLTLMETLKRGEVVVFDEAGVDFDARRSSSNKNIFFSNILKTFRYRQIPTIFTLPHLAMLDKNARRLFHYWIKTRSIDYKRQICWTSFYIIDSNDDWKDVIKRCLVRVKDPKTHEKRKIIRVGFHRPPQKLIDDYEKIKDEYVEAMLEDMKRKMSPKDGEEGDDAVEPSLQELRNRRVKLLNEPENRVKSSTPEKPQKEESVDPDFADLM